MAVVRWKATEGSEGSKICKKMQNLQGELNPGL